MTEAVCTKYCGRLATDYYGVTETACTKHCDRLSIERLMCPSLVGTPGLHTSCITLMTLAASALTTNFATLSSPVRQILLGT